MDSIVVARFNEDIEWLHDKRLKNYEKFIYNKGKKVAGQIPLKNFGREAHTYLTHILNNYNSLQDDKVSTFLQGDPFPHINHDFIADLAAGLPRDKFFGFGCHQTKLVVSPFSAKRNGTQIFSDADSNAIYQACQFVKPKQPDYVYILRVSHFACFSVPNRLIKKFPVDFYKFLLDVSVNSPFGPHCLEMLWQGIFDTSALV